MIDNDNMKPALAHLIMAGCEQSDTDEADAVDDDNDDHRMTTIENADTVIEAVLLTLHINRNHPYQQLTRDELLDLHLSSKVEAFLADVRKGLAAKVRVKGKRRPLAMKPSRMLTDATVVSFERNECDDRWHIHVAAFQFSHERLWAGADERVASLIDTCWRKYMPEPVNRDCRVKPVMGFVDGELSILYSEKRGETNLAGAFGYVRKKQRESGVVVRHPTDRSASRRLKEKMAVAVATTERVHPIYELSDLLMPSALDLKRGVMTWFEVTDAQLPLLTCSAFRRNKSKVDAICAVLDEIEYAAPPSLGPKAVAPDEQVFGDWDSAYLKVLDPNDVLGRMVRRQYKWSKTVVRGDVLFLCQPPAVFRALYRYRHGRCFTPEMRRQIEAWDKQHFEGLCQQEYERDLELVRGQDD